TDPGTGDLHLTSDLKRRILTATIYGVDLDPGAVEVSQLSLYLKMLEGENRASLARNRDLFGNDAPLLPPLQDNIKCGNSLIGSDFYAQPDLPEMDADAHLRINVFDWDGKDGFPEIMQAGGFDAVIGNPPYVRQESIKESKNYFESHYESYDGIADLYTYFMERGVKLLRPGGLFSIIVSSSFLRTTYGTPLRRVLKKHAAVRRMVDFGGLAVFASAKDTYVCIPLLERGGKQSKVEVSKVPALDLPNLSEHVAAHHYLIPGERLSDGAWSLKSDEEAALFAKVMKCGKPLGRYVDEKLFYGIKTGLNEAFVITSSTREELIHRDPKSTDLIKPLLGGEDIRRYEIRETDAWIIFTRRGVDIDAYPAIKEHLSKWKQELTPRNKPGMTKGRKPGRYQWYEIQDDVAYFASFDASKIIFPDICKGPRFYPDDSGTYIANTAYCLGTGDRYLLGFLNSRLFWFAIANISIPFGVRAGEFRYRLIYQYMEKVPVRVIDPKNKSDQAAHDRIVSLVEKMLSLHRQRAAAKTPHEQTALDRQIGATDALIDREVYALYGLTPEEIALVEGSAMPAEEPEVPAATPAPASILEATLEYPHKAGYRGHMVFREEPVEYTAARQSSPPTTHPEKAAP
ncbi:MAG: TaqI-like C-terminal specificity domain-containing protein, partial [Prosthecobacter sp.]|nr:TaqI-like C-terminal specificity domain-containing protein [Prosthecobacter sp.]